MPTIRNQPDRAALVVRLDRLTTRSTPGWGRMNVAQMLAHITDAFRMALGELPVLPKPMPLLRHFPFKHLILYVVPFPRNAPTAAELIARAPDSIDREKERVKQLMERLAQLPADAPRALHPIFGLLTTEEWGTLGHKHLDHHLRQFGV